LSDFGRSNPISETVNPLRSAARDAGIPYRTRSAIEINAPQQVTKTVVEAARENLVIGQA
jgi:hypothetical protein